MMRSTIKAFHTHHADLFYQITHKSTVADATILAMYDPWKPLIFFTFTQVVKQLKQWIDEVERSFPVGFRIQLYHGNYHESHQRIDNATNWNLWSKNQGEHTDSHNFTHISW